MENECRKEAGTLYLCATPIGNLEDITLRVLRVLKEADLIAAEDTRNSIKLLNHFDIHTPMTSYHEYNKYDKGKYLVSQLEEGKDVALITDAGTPGISDPGEELVKMCAAAGIRVTTLPGACACVSALTLSGLATRRFAFEAFLPADKKERKAVLEEMKNETRTLIIYEAPHRIRETLSELLSMLGNRQVSICRELTKKHEEVYRTDLEAAAARFSEEEPRGEFVLVIEGRSRGEIEQERRSSWESIPVPEHVEMYEKQGLPRKEAMRKAASDRGVSRRDIYNEMIELEKNQ